MPAGVADRIVALDLIRGVAVLGILAINIAGFAGPMSGIVDPFYPPPATRADLTAYAVKFVLFDGKMRALFTILFGASMVLFIERAQARGRDGHHLQRRRLGWLMLFGLAHFYLIWWGDILFLYGVMGLLALPLSELRTRTLVVLAVGGFVVWHAVGAALYAPLVGEEQRVLAGLASTGEVAAHDVYLGAVAEYAAGQLAVYRGGYLDQLAHRVGELGFFPYTGLLGSVGETLPLMLLGMILFRTGFFAGAWGRRRMGLVAAGATATGLALSAAILGWLWHSGFGIRSLDAANLYWTAIPRALTAFGYAGMLVLAAPALARTALGERLVAAGRMAFSNYIASSIVMTAIFYGWGLGLAGTAGHAMQWAYVALGWLLMLAWSRPLLQRYRHGPLEWIWRNLTEQEMLPNTR